MIAIDCTTLLMFLSPDTLVPVDQATGKPIDKPKERIDFLISKLQKSRTKIVIPTPAYSEALIRAGSARNDYLRIIDNHAVFKVCSFDTRAAIEVADMTRSAIAGGDKREGSSGTWAKVKYDRQIVAIAKVEGVTTLYSDDADVRRIGDRHGVLVLSLAECALPPGEDQSSLPLDSVMPKKEAEPTLPPPVGQDIKDGTEEAKTEEASAIVGGANQEIPGSGGEGAASNGRGELQQGSEHTNGADGPEDGPEELGQVDTASGHQRLTEEEADALACELERQDDERLSRIAKHQPEASSSDTKAGDGG